jgi:sugar/nucleoside kinase (ribokinase family)
VIVAGNVNVDLVMGPLARWPRFGTETVLPHSDLRVGGQAGNTGLALAALGAPHRVVSGMGSDALGDWLRSAFPRSAIHWARSSAPATVSVGLVHPDGERTFLTSAGHLPDFTPDEVLAQLPDRAGPGDIVLLCGVFLSPRLVAGGAALLREIRRRGFAVALDAGWPDAGWDAVRATVASWLPGVDHVLFNEIETTSLAGVDDPDDLEAAIAWFQARLPRGAVLVVKRGALGVLACRGTERMRQAAPAVTVLDTIGAGDTFNAGYLAAVAGGADLAAAVSLGITTATTAISTTPRRYR